MVRIFCKNTQTYKEFEAGTTLLEMLPEFQFEQPYQIISAKVNNVSQGLNFRVYNSRDVEYVDGTESSGQRVYQRSLFFLLCKAAHEVFPGCRVYIEHPLSGGFYCNLKKKDDEDGLTPEDIERIKARMWEIVNEDMEFHRREVQIGEAIKLFRELGYIDKVRLLDTSPEVYTDYYLLGDSPDYYYGRLLPSAGYLKVWDIMPCHDGLLIRVPDRHDPTKLTPYVPQPKTYEIFSEALRWNIITKLNNVGDVNHKIRKGGASELIQVAEALQEKKIVKIAEEIEARYYGENKVNLVLITGPSSSGKTTFCKRLSVQLKACGLQPISFSTDDYFVNRVDTPLLPNGQYDFDNFETVDHDALQEDLVKLLDGQEVKVPSYNFTTGLREYNGKKLKMREGSVLLIEGIHALNPRLTDKVDDKRKFKIFISTLTSISLDNHNCIPTSDNRLLRRIIRDYNKGAFTPTETIRQWPNVLDAEEKWINPYQENSDVMFNSS
ncbi:MAG: nucleoside kinase, partial [Bacteroidales bacterium]|nr:nucleoside kinase [Bacteroidales bacterium]